MLGIAQPRWSVGACNVRYAFEGSGASRPDAMTTGSLGEVYPWPVIDAFIGVLAGARWFRYAGNERDRDVAAAVCAAKLVDW